MDSLSINIEIHAPDLLKAQSHRLARVLCDKNMAAIA